MGADRDKIKLALLRALSDAGTPAGATHVSEYLLAAGIDLQPRSVRRYLLECDREGLTRLVSRRHGRVLTEEGMAEIAGAGGVEKGGIISARVDALAYRMLFDIEAGHGTVIVNVSYVDPGDLGTALREIQLVTGQGLGFGSKIAVVPSGGTLGGSVVPEGMTGIGTICSITLNGIMQKAGIPVMSRFGGLLGIKDRRTTGFLNRIEYSGSTLDPLEVFIRADMTRVRDVVLRGTGVICASFREFPSPAADHVKSIAQRMRNCGLAGIIAVGRPNQPLFGIPVAEGRCGLIVSGGLNAIASARESGVRITFRSLSGLEDFEIFTSVREAIRQAKS